MAQLVQCLPCKHEILSSDPQLPCESWALQHMSVTLAFGSKDRRVLGPH